MKRRVFLVIWIGVFFASYVILSIAQFVPLEFVEINGRIIDAFTLVFKGDPQNANPTVIVETDMGETSEPQEFAEKVLPQRLIISKINVDTPIINPETRDIAVLDKALLEGVVRYPGSGGLDDQSNMFFFGHSTNWTSVRNQAFKSLNRLDELKIGDAIIVHSGGNEYRYSVASVSKVNKDEALVEFSVGEKLITLSTCDTFGARSDRFVVTAKFIQMTPVGA